MLLLRFVMSPSLRSLKFELNRVCFGPSSFSTRHDVTACAQRASQPRVCNSRSTEGTHRTSGHIGNGAQSLGVAPTPTLGVVVASLSCLDRTQSSPRHRGIGGGRGMACGSDKTRYTLLTAPVNEPVCCSTFGINLHAGTASFGDGLRVSAMDRRSAGVEAGLTRIPPCWRRAS